MARNGSGTYNRAVAPYVAGTTITAATVNQEMDDLAAALTQSMAHDGQSPATANIPMGGFRLTGLGNAIASTDAAPLGQVLAKAGDTATGALGVIAGTAAAPGVFVSGDTNTGLFQPAADTLAVSVGGAEVARFGANGMQSASPWVDLPAETILDLGAVNSESIRITNPVIPGPVTVTQFGTAANGVRRRIRFAVTSGLTINHSSAIICPGAQNLSFAPNDVIDVQSDGSNVWRIIFVSKSAALPLLPGAITSSDLTMATGRLLGRVTAATGAIEEIPLGNTAAALSLGISRGTEQATNTGQVQYDFTGIPAGVREITIMFDNVSTNGTSPIIIQLGTSGGFVTSGYLGAGSRFSSVVGTVSFTAGIAGFPPDLATDAMHGSIILSEHSANKWVAQGAGYFRTNAGWVTGGGSGALGGAVSQLRLTTVGGTNTFDAGSVNISWKF